MAEIEQLHAFVDAFEHSFLSWESARRHSRGGCGSMKHRPTDGILRGGKLDGAIIPNAIYWGEQIRVAVYRPGTFDVYVKTAERDNCAVVLQWQKTVTNDEI